MVNLPSILSVKIHCLNSDSVDPHESRSPSFTRYMSHAVLSFDRFDSFLEALF